MSIATRADTSRDRPALVAAGVSTSALDRVLAPLADLGAAIREEIAASLTPLAAEFEASLKQVSTLEARVRDLEARLAGAAAALGAASPAAGPDTPSLSTETGTVAEPQALAETPTRRKRPRRRPAQDGSVAAPIPIAPMADVPATLFSGDRRIRPGHARPSAAPAVDRQSVPAGCDAD